MSERGGRVPVVTRGADVGQIDARVAARDEESGLADVRQGAGRPWGTRGGRTTAWSRGEGSWQGACVRSGGRTAGGDAGRGRALYSGSEPLRARRRDGGWHKRWAARRARGVGAQSRRGAKAAGDRGVV